MTNPVDALFFVHRGLLGVHRASLLHRKRDEPLTGMDLKQIVCFDDLFALLVGVVAASDIDDFAAFAEFVESYTPARGIAKAFEYAKAAISALRLHFASVDIDALEARAGAQPRVRAASA